MAKAIEENITEFTISRKSGSFVKILKIESSQKCVNIFALNKKTSLIGELQKL